MSIERITKVVPAYDCIGVQPCKFGKESCYPGSGHSHGRHNAELHMIVRDDGVEVILIVSTGWDLPTVPAHQRCSNHLQYPRGCVLEYHTARPTYEDQSGGSPQPGAPCEHWSACYSAVSYIGADEPVSILVEKGSDAVWDWLEVKLAETRAKMDELSKARR